MDAYIIGAKNAHTGRMIAAIDRMHAGPIFCGFIDNDPARQGTFCGLPVIGGFERLSELIAEGCGFINTVSGSTRSRIEVTQTVLSAGGKLLSFLWPDTVLWGVEIGSGVYIQEGNLIQAGVEIGDYCAIHMGNRIAHETKVGAHSFISFGCNIAGEVAIGQGVFVGAGATILPRIRVGDWATIGAGAVVTKDVEPGVTVIGNPARPYPMTGDEWMDGNH